MKVTLQIKKKEFDLIQSGLKKVEWRQPSKFNTDKLFKQPHNKGDRDGNPDITEIVFINGMKPDSPRLTIECKHIRMIASGRDFSIAVEGFEVKDFTSMDDYKKAVAKYKGEKNALHVRAGQRAVEISLGKILR